MKILLNKKLSITISLIAIFYFIYKLHNNPVETLINPLELQTLVINDILALLSDTEIRACLYKSFTYYHPEVQIMVWERYDVLSIGKIFISHIRFNLINENHYGIIVDLDIFSAIKTYYIARKESLFSNILYNMLLNNSLNIDFLYCLKHILIMHNKEQTFLYKIVSQSIE